MSKEYITKKVLTYLLGFLWYGGITVAAAIVIGVILFNLSVFGFANIQFPAISFDMNKYSYMFDTKYLEIKRYDSLIFESIEESLAWEYYYSSPARKAIAKFYRIDFSKLPPLPKGALPISRIPITSIERLLPLRYMEHAKISQFTIGYSLFVVSFLLIALIIIFNLRMIFNSYISNNIFQSENIKRIRYIGIYFILFELVRLLIFYLVNDSVAKTEWFDGARQSFALSFSDINVVLIFAGCSLWIISEIFKMGTMIKEEIDLTV